MSNQELITITSEDLVVSPQAFEHAIKSISDGAESGINFPDDEETVRNFIASKYRTLFGKSQNYNKQGTSDASINQGEVYFSRTLIEAIKGNASWKGLIMDLYGVAGIGIGHHQVALSLHNGTLNDVATERSATAFLLEIGAPISDIFEVLKIQNSQLISESE